MHDPRRPFTFDPKINARSERLHFERHVSLPKKYLSFLLTILVFVFVLLIAFHMSEERDFLVLLEKASPIWIIVGLFFQGGTYFSEAMTWRTGLKARGLEMGLNKLVGLSLAQLFMNQVVPSASISGAFFVSKALGQRGIPRKDVSATLGLSLISYFEAYSLAIILAVIQLGLDKYIRLNLMMVIILSLVIFCFGVVFVSRKIEFNFLRGLKKSHVLNNIRNLAEGMNLRELSNSLIIKCSTFQLLIFVFDFLTLWSMLKALGITASIGPVFTAYIVACISRSIGFLPGGIGIFEAAAIATLHKAGVSMAGSIAATLLYRGLSFWLPMIPGLFLVRREFHHAKRINSYKVENFWNLNFESALKILKTSKEGLSSNEAKTRLILQGPNQINEHKSLGLWDILWNQIKSPLVILLLFASIISLFVGEWIDASIILSILLIGSGIGTLRESQAQTALEKLKMRLAPRTNVKREGVLLMVPCAELVPGDVIMLSAGSMVPADLLILNSQDCYVNEATITGESVPVLKIANPEGIVKEAALGERSNSMFLGSHVETGFAECLIINTGVATMFGAIEESLNKAVPQTDFDRGITSFGYLMVKTMLIIVVSVFFINSLTSGLTIESLMFSVALAVGLNPELLPLIINYNLSRSSRVLADKGLLVRQPKALENLAAMDVLCTDKTGTITEGVVEISGAFDIKGERSESVLNYAVINSLLQSGMTNPLDEILKKQSSAQKVSVKKIGEIPYDFQRKRLSVIVEENGVTKVITKGAFQKVMEVCQYDADGNVLDQKTITNINSLFEKWSGQGARVLGVAICEVSSDLDHGPYLEEKMRFVGLLAFDDKPKKNIIQTLSELKNMGVRIKIISGDNTLVTQTVAREVGLDPQKILEGKDIDRLSNEALPQMADEMELFTQVDPRQKERIVIALRKKGHTVGYMGDGINDVSAMHAADTSISVESAVDVAKSTADLVLLEKSLELIAQGITEGRKTFINSMKYVNITMSANLGNMISMAIASIILPFLPLLASQVLLNNLLSDIPSLGLAGDNVDEDQVRMPTRWDIKAILRYMIAFGLISSLFDLLTFFILLRYFHVTVQEFRTSWFTESLLTELLIVMVLRTKQPFYKGRPTVLLALLTFLLVVVCLTLSYFPMTDLLGFAPLKVSLLAFVVVITIFYLITTELMKSWLQKKYV